MSKQTVEEAQVIVNDGMNQRLWSFSEEGILVRLRLEDGRFEVSIEGGGKADPIQLRDALCHRLRIDAVQDRAYPFRDYHPSLRKGEPISDKRVIVE